jgi:hypothetical protein
MAVHRWRGGNVIRSTLLGECRCDPVELNPPAHVTEQRKLARRHVPAGQSEGGTGFVDAVRQQGVGQATMAIAGPRCSLASTINRLSTPEAKLEGLFFNGFF